MFRTENYARKLPKESNLPLISVMLATIASMSFLLTASQHVPETQALLANPAAVLPVLAGLTWKQIITILYTGVLSTDGVLLIEVTMNARVEQQGHLLRTCPISVMRLSYMKWLPCGS